MYVRVLRVSNMPFNVQIWVTDSDDGQFTIYIDRKLITECGALAMQRILTSTITGWQRLDEARVRRILRAVTG